MIMRRDFLQYSKDSKNIEFNRIRHDPMLRKQRLQNIRSDQKPAFNRDTSRIATNAHRNVNRLQFLKAEMSKMANKNK
jgi:hypothetical protein